MDLGEAEVLAKEEMALWLDSDWKFGWTDAQSEFGHCDNRTETIRLSRVLVGMNAQYVVLDVIRHEIAHALTPRTAESHGVQWQRNCGKVGAKPERCYSPKEVKVPEFKWRGVCDRGHVTYRRTLFQASKETIGCGQCCDALNDGRWHASLCFKFYDAKTGEPA